MMGVLIDRWRAAKQLFKTTAKVKKPSPTVGAFASKTLGIEKALTKVEAAEAKGVTVPKNLVAFKAAIKEFQVAKTNYIVVLDATVGKEPAGADRDLYRKGVAVLRTELNALDSTLKMQVVKADSIAAGNTLQRVMADSLMHDVAKGCDDALAFIARIRTNPTAAAFNQGIETAARDITQYAGNINRLTTAGFVFAKAEPTNLLAVLKAWSNDHREVPPNATAAQVLKELKAFEMAVKGIKTWAA
jgi:hypothetical protein